MNPLIFIAGGVIAATLVAIINKTNQKGDNRLNLTIDKKETINNDTVIENLNDGVKTDDNKQNSVIDDNSGNSVGGGDNLGIEEKTDNHLIEKDRDNAKQISTDDSGDNGGNSSGTDASTTNT